ncbi:MAG: thioredoxin [Acidobacteria bacterium]|jgi:hydrogenase-1 operon protein HyaE|nr:MAG: thioredoxin [Acidobacteriota bacterium]
MKSLKKEEFLRLIEAKDSFVLYVRSEIKKDKIREIFDTDVVIREIEKLLGDKADVFYVNVDEDSELFFLKKYKLPSVIVFKKGEERTRLEGINH